ncbi:MAG: class I SAM-dependent methyltransferase [Elusimicrobiota bacterium]
MKKIHEVEWAEEKIKSLWEMYETLPELSEGMFLPADFYKCVIKNVKKFFRLPGKALDIGCGIGTLMDELYNIGFEVYGCDVSRQNIKSLKEKFSSLNKNIILKEGSITNLPLVTCFFDYVFVTEVLEHLLPDTLEKGLKEIKRVLKPLGKVIITVPYKENIQKVVCPDCYAVFPPSEHLASFDEEKMKGILTESGLKVEFCKLVPKIPLTGNKIKDFVKRFIALIDKRAISFMYGSVFITVASKQGCDQD